MRTLFLLFALCPACGAPPAASPGDVAERSPDPIAHYLALPAPDSALAARLLDELEEALEEWRDDPGAEAAIRVDEIFASIPTLADWRPLVRAELLAGIGDTLGTRLALEELDARTPYLERWGWRALVDAYEEADDSPGARRTAERFARELPAGFASAAWLRSGELALEANDTLMAREAFVRALESGAEGAAARSAARRLDRLPDPPGGWPAELEILVGRALVGGGEWEGALRRLAHRLGTDAVEGADEVEIRLGVGRAHFEMGRYGEAEAALAPLAAEYGSLPERTVAEVLYLRGRAALGRGDRAAAESAFRRIAEVSPSSLRAEEGVLLLLDGASGARHDEVLELLYEVGVRSVAGELAALRPGTERYLRGDYHGAATAFDRYADGSRRTATRQQAVYWAGLAHGRAGNAQIALARLEEAHQADPMSFYGVVAGERLGAPVLSARLVSGPSRVPGITDELGNALIRLRAHQLIPTSGSFNYELDRLSEHFFQRGDAAYDLAEAMIEGAFPLQGIVLGREIHSREGAWNLRLLRIVHPLPHRDVIVRESRARGLDPFFVAGLIRQESMFHTSIRSAAGAVGLMQLMPGTAREVAQAAGMNYSLAALSDPEFNIRLGTAFLLQMVQRFDGRAEDALSAYNAGPTRIRQWRQRPEYRDRDVFMESIPFRETRHYVKVVQQYTRIYTALYGCGDFEPCLGMSYPTAVAQSPVAGGVPGTAVAR